MIVIFVPSAAKMQAYSQPITPPPTTASESGMRSRSRIVSESSTSGSSNGTPAGRSGELPVAMRNTRADDAGESRRPPASRTMSSSGDANSAGATDDGDVVAIEIARNLIDLFAGDRAQPSHQPAQAALAIDVERHAVQLAPLEAGQVERGLAQRLRRQRAGVHARAAHGSRPSRPSRHACRSTPPAPRLFRLPGRSRSRPDRTARVSHRALSVRHVLLQSASFFTRGHLLISISRRNARPFERKRSMWTSVTGRRPEGVLGATPVVVGRFRAPAGRAHSRCRASRRRSGRCRRSARALRRTADHRLSCRP